MKISIASPDIGEKEISAVRQVMESGMLAQGKKVLALEEKFAEYCQTGFCVATSNGTTALHTALLGLGIGKGDEVITSPFSFIATANSIAYCGATPVFADIDSEFNLDPERIVEKITPRTKAIMPVHLFGNPASMGRIMEIAKKHSLAVVEDACQAHGAEISGKRAGSFGDAGCFSFYPTKNMTTGEGGAITCNEAGLADRCRMIREHGSRKRYEHEMVGYNYRMTDIAAAIGVEQLAKLEGYNRKRIENAGIYGSLLSGIKGIKIPQKKEGAVHVYHQYTIRVQKELFGMDRDSLAKSLSDAGIGFGIYYPKCIHLQKPYLGKEGEFPESEKASWEVLSLPVHPKVGKEGIEFVCQKIKEAAR